MTDRLSHAEEKLILALHRRKERAARGLFLAEGVRVAEELLDAGIETPLVVTSPGLEDTERGRALAADSRLVDRRRIVPDAFLTRLAATDTPQGILLVGTIPQRAADFLAESDDAPILLVDAVQDPGNLGTLIRAADAFGARAVIALPGTVDPWNAKTVRAAAGSAFRVPILHLDADDARARLKAAGYRILVADAGGSAVDTVGPGPVALVVGNEGAGVSRDWTARADAVVAVPTPGPVESLNVAVATGILLYELHRMNRERNR